MREDQQPSSTVDQAKAMRARILELGARHAVYDEQAVVMVEAMLHGPEEREAYLSAILSADTMRWLPLATATRMAEDCLRIARAPKPGGEPATMPGPR